MKKLRLIGLLLVLTLLCGCGILIKPKTASKKELEKTLQLGFSDAFLEDILFNNFANFYHYKKL